MLRKLFTSLSIIASISLMQAQNESAIKVTLSDKANRETIPFANVVVEMGGIQVGVGTTNIDGEVMIRPLNPGKYNVKATYVGYQSIQIDNVMVPVGKTVYLKMELTAGQELPQVEVVEYSVPLIDPDTKSGTTVSREDYQNMASKNINSVAASTAGIYQQDEGSALNVRGARSNGTAYYVDGQKVIGSAGVPQSGVEQVTTITGGTPAEYGDVTGGIISITTRGPASKYAGSVELITSGAGENKGLDAYGYNFIGFAVSGPIKMKQDTASGVKKSILGFSLQGQATTVKDPDPLAGGTYRVNKDKLAELEQNPLSPAPQGGYIANAEYVTMNDLEKIKARQNVGSNGLILNGKVQYQPTANMGITLGGSVNHTKNHNYINTYALFNPVNNSQTIATTWRAYAKLTQKFNTATTKEEEKSSSIIKNAYFTLQASYEKFKSTTQDDNHKDNFFDYGYIGKFKQYIDPNPANDTATRWIDADKDGFREKYFGVFQEGWDYYDLTFSPGDKNPTATNYTKQYYQYEGSAENPSDVQSNLGLMNGDRSTNVYSIWFNTGRENDGYGKFDQSQFRVFANFSADIKDHTIQLGFEYEQRTQRNFSLAPVGLWTRMYAIANSHLTQLDSFPQLQPDLQSLWHGDYDYFTFNRLNDNLNADGTTKDEPTQSQFDRKLREKLGYNVNGTDWIDIHSYDPSTYSLDMFSADDLINLNGGSYVGYYGYDHTGKKIKGQTNIDDFYSKKDENNNYMRQVGAYQPIYIAGYIQDKFDFKDIKFNVGLRVDRFDANQQVLKDKYLLHETRTANEVDYTKFPETRPSNIGDDYAVYVNDKDKPTAILGYRDGDTWYNAQGNEVDSRALRSGAKVNPYLVDPSAKEINSKVFKDYVPQISVMPRIAFAFPISDEANFFAHYDVLTQRPPGANRLDPIQYLKIEQNSGAFINNPDLKPEKTIDYELGFTQVLNERKNSAITISAFYRELRDMIQTSVINDAYPIAYKTWTNIDFGTVKGFSMAYDLRRTGGIRFTANYVLQFADGTGSDPSDGGTLAASGMPNLRVTHPLDYDQRHVIKFNVDYRFEEGKDYNGPVLTLKKGSDKEKTIKLLENVGANLQFQAGSGTPYTRQTNITQDVAIGVSQTSILK
ncbi:MAG: TonB-dependent receptor domain-containing protein, partial [Bacteroidota bacterium]